MSNLHNFVEETYQRLQHFNTNPKETTGIRNAVENLVQCITSKAGEIDERFKQTEILKVGSFYEGAKIFNPKEFDFLLVIHDLSQPASITLHSVPDGNARIILQDSRGIRRHWLHTINSKFLLNFNTEIYDVDSELNRRFPSFFTVLGQVVNKYYSDLFISNESGKLVLKYIRSCRGPNTIVKCLWHSNKETSFYISIDISPALRCSVAENVFQEESCVLPFFYKKLQETGSFLAVPTRQKNSRTVFKLSFTQTEFNIIASLCPIHKAAYVCLKHLLQYPKAEVCAGLPSYTIKMALLHHLPTCSNTHHAQCIRDIVAFLIRCMENRVLVHPFLKTYNLLDKLASINVFTQDGYVWLHTDNSIWELQKLGLNWIEKWMEEMSSCTLQFSKFSDAYDHYEAHQEKLVQTISELCPPNTVLDDDDNSDITQRARRKLLH